MIGNQIKYERELLQLSQTELANKLNISQKTVASWEVNRTEPSLSFISQLSDLFGVTIDYLLGKDKNRERAVLIKNLINDTNDIRKEFLGKITKEKQQ